MTSSVATQAQRSSSRRARNRDQTLVAQHLIDTARDHLAGRDASGQRLVDVRPREQVVLGVLLPQPHLPAAPAVTAADVPHEPGVPVDHLPASEIGLTALINPDNRRLSLRVKARFALYLQHAPTYAEQAEHSGILRDQPEDMPPIDGEPDDQPSTNTDQAPNRLPDDPTDQELAQLSDDAAAAVLLAVQGARQGGAGGAAAAHAAAHHVGESDFLRPVYQRYDVVVEHDLAITIPNDARPHTVGEDGAYRTAIADIAAPALPQHTGHHAGSLLIPMRGPSAMRIPRAVVQDGSEAYEAHLRDHARTNWSPPLPAIAFRATVQRMPDGLVRLAVTLVNEESTPQSDRGYLPEAAVYDAGFQVAVGGAAIVPSEYRLVERDYRTQPLVHAHGRFCCLDEDIFAATGELATTTLPVHRQMVYESKPELQPTFTDLAADPLPALRDIERHMSDFASAWDKYLRSTEMNPVARRACEQDRIAFGDELRRFRRGMELIQSDLAGIGMAFRRANEAFALMNTEGGLDNPLDVTATSWRLFQIVYVVANLASLAAREAPLDERKAWVASRDGSQGRPGDSPDLDDLSIADVLWFPTGGGKSAALYGVVAVALFFDRFRGKHGGVTSVIRFPLRMLSVQQLERVLRLVVACEMIREAHHDPGEPFRLGYWVGRSNTPNRITDPSDERWHDLRWMAHQNADWKRDNTVLPTCPYCGQSNVALEPDPADVVLAHRCASCNKTLPVDVTDDEVYRNLPAVLIGTVDKIASLAFNAHASHLTHGPAFRCPDHGFVTYPQGANRRCLARDACTRTQADWEDVTIKDPAPALVIQDELHLLSEELGTFAAHYETLWQHLCTVGSGLPSKVLAATATISDYENQVSQLYALRPRRFPTDGWVDGESFYASRHDDLVRRIFVGALPTQMDVVQFALATGEAIRTELTRLTEMSEDQVVSTLGLSATAPEELAELLFQYELQVFYCNRKSHADRVHARAERVGRTTLPGFQSVRLNGQTPLAEISDVIRRVEGEDLTTAPGQRLGSMAGTSLISHGVDLERLNVLHILGMPSSIAYYVQATSRAGRTNVGIVLTSLARHFVRDRSVFHFFDPQHRYVNVLVEPVALNRFSTHGPRKTGSGMVAALLTQQWGRDLELLSAAGLGHAPADLTRADNVRRLITLLRRRAEEGALDDPVRLLQQQAHSAYGLHSQVLDPHVAQRFADSVDLQISSLLTSIEGAHETLLARSLRPRPPTSLRDVDASADFGAGSYPARRRFEFLGGMEYDDDEDDFGVAEEGGS